VEVSEDKGGGRWSRDQLKLAFYLYCQLPFGKLHSENPDIVALAARIGRTPSAVAMKLSNFASLDPSITGSGRKGLQGASQLDREVWDEFHADWERLAMECAALESSLGGTDGSLVDESDALPENFSGQTRRAYVEQRIKQAFFRRAVLSSYRGRCCMSGVDVPKLLVASHIVPWSKDAGNRLNPRNGLCLSAIHDRAFDQGLITLTDDLRVLVSRSLRESNNEFTRATFAALHQREIERPERFAPDRAFLDWHRDERFVGAS
jgi:hypothetical protein